ncbi:MAG: glycosyltransferase family 61 protein [Cyclobacteriaceae bacterium]|nr:glycosyltransferase family 61 protein [Cyclobacteriaceae bacterium]
MSIFKKTLKKIFPSAFLKETFLIVNKIKIRTIDRLLFPEYSIDQTEFLVYRNGFPFRESQISVEDLPEDEVKAYMCSWYDWTQEEFLLVFNKPCWIEPDFGWAIVEPNKLVYYSLGVSRTWFQKKPSLLKFFRKKNTLVLPKAISLRDTGEENYFHFYNDVVSKLFFLQQQGMEIETIPVIISRKLWDKAYFQFTYQKHKRLQSLTWIVQEADQYIRCDSVIFCKPLTHKKELWGNIISPLRVDVLKSGFRKIFLTRNKSRLRFIENSEVIEATAQRLGFEIIDTDELPIEEQIQIFSNTEFLVGIHGAGLTNMVFRNESCHVLELFPPADLGYLPYHYIMLAKMSGFQYRAMIGKPSRVSFSGGFYVEPAQFDAVLKEFLLPDHNK